MTSASSHEDRARSELLAAMGDDPTNAVSDAIHRVINAAIARESELREKVKLLEARNQRLNAEAHRNGERATEEFGRAEALHAELEELRAGRGNRDQQHAEHLVEQTRFRGITVDNDGVNLDLVPPRELAALWVHCAQGMLNDAPNYTETVVEMPSVSMEVGFAGEPERYALIVQRVGKITPHQARQKAEAERAALWDLLRKQTRQVRIWRRRANTTLTEAVEQTARDMQRAGQLRRQLDEARAEVERLRAALSEPAADTTPDASTITDRTCPDHGKEN